MAIAVNIRGIYDGPLECLRYAFFQVTSIISTTGFATADYCTWPQLSQMIVIALMLCGACAGSTGGGIKCSRVLLSLRTIRRELRRVIHPRLVEVVKLDGKVAEEDTLSAIQTFIACYGILIMAASLIVSLDNFTFSETITAAITCISNVGPGMGLFGPVGNFSYFSDLSKLTLSLLMVVGRLEIFPILVLFSRRAWRKA